METLDAHQRGEKIQRGRDILDINTLRIPFHAIDPFCLWTQADFATAPDAIRERLSEAIFTAHFTKGDESWHFQDSEDPKLLYVVKLKKHKYKKEQYLATVVNVREKKFRY